MKYTNKRATNFAAMKIISTVAKSVAQLLLALTLHV